MQDKFYQSAKRIAAKLQNNYLALRRERFSSY